MRNWCMVEKAEEVVASISVTYADPFNLKELYKHMFFWIEENGYLTGSIKEPDIETLYSEKDKGGIKEYNMFWHCEKKPDNPYFRYYLKIDWLGLGIGTKEIVKNDKKYKMQVGEINIYIKAILKMEQNKKKDPKGVIGKTIQEKFREHWYKKVIKEHEKELYEDAYRLQQLVKEYLELYQYERPDNLFYNPKGYQILEIFFSNAINNSYGNEIVHKLYK